MKSKRVLKWLTVVLLAPALLIGAGVLPNELEPLGKALAELALHPGSAE